MLLKLVPAQMVLRHRRHLYLVESWHAAGMKKIHRFLWRMCRGAMSLAVIMTTKFVLMYPCHPAKPRGDR